jgi:hypothetical protein
VAGGAISYSSNAFVVANGNESMKYVRNHATTWNTTVSSFVSKAEVIYDKNKTPLVKIGDLTGDKYPLNHDSLDRFETLMCNTCKEYNFTNSFKENAIEFPSG